MDNNLGSFINQLRELMISAQNSINDSVKVGVKNLENRREAAKLSSQILRLRAEIEDLFVIAGERIYHSHNVVKLEDKEDPSHVFEIFVQIEDKLKQIQTLTGEVELKNGGSVCTNCETICSQGDLFCTHCGSPLFAVEDTDRQKSDSEGVDTL